MAGLPLVHRPFALTPTQSVVGIINYSTSEGRNIYRSATKQLTEELFDCNSEDMFGFLKALEERARQCGWDEEGMGITSIPVNHADLNTTYTSLLTNHGEISMVIIRKFETQYIALPIRAAQDANQMYTCLMNSLSKTGKQKVVLWHEEYLIGDIGSVNLLLKKIIMESHLDTNATASTIRKQLAKLDLYLPKIGHNIIKFNTHVMMLISGLQARGQT